MLTLVMEITEKKVESKVHKSLAQILGIPTRGQKTEQPKVAVVIDPKIAKVLRPHQIEGVKVVSMRTLTRSFSTERRLARYFQTRLDVSWQTRWV